MPGAQRYVQQDTATCGPTAGGHKVKPPAHGTGGSAGNFLQEPVQKEKTSSSRVMQGGGGFNRTVQPQAT